MLLCTLSNCTYCIYAPYALSFVFKNIMSHHLVLSSTSVKIYLCPCGVCLAAGPHISICILSPKFGDNGVTRSLGRFCLLIFVSLQITHSCSFQSFISYGIISLLDFNNLFRYP